ncbi:guanylate kinase [Lactobacillus hominis]|uniref:Guanylate kinase n=1 Tax=Lactobacillus hominis DSM 23910 = CRBIP 24.179 TaxID=1423758 RepID=I7KHX3_9LACO|nr:guanylate kinase [Lactobacillus hominis]KRM85125.1 Gmk, Guanylate kinase [Lactobacillus hominis DSM 23910 = CRBIP 24.179]MCT3348285.1 guanylate kinase [Lactobacillus hominis]CCI82485.1 Guanylate kinase [Lactobacillus hominis DSM 23910 = CRBIP 24.179]
MQRIIIIAGPSGVGKTTVSNYLNEKYNIPRVITHTTRPMRKGEIQGKSYYFEDDDSFKKLHFFEHVKYGQYQYGSSKEALKHAWDKNDIVSLIVETDGVKSYLDVLGDQVYFIYLAVDDRDVLKKRLVKRGDDPAEIEKRLNSAEFKRDLSLRPELEKNAHILKNNNWQETKSSLDKIISSLRNA